MEIHFFFIAMLFFLDSLVGSFRPVSPKKRQIRVVAKGIPLEINDADILIPALQLGALSIALFVINGKVDKTDEKIGKLESKIDNIETKFVALSGEFKMTLTVVATVAIVFTGLNSIIETSMNINTFTEKQTKGKIFNLFAHASA